MKKTWSLAQAVAHYLKCRRRLGFALDTDGRILRSLVRYAHNTGHRGPLTNKLATQWAQSPTQAQLFWWARRLDVVRRFARFWCHFDARTEVPPEGLFGPSQQRRAVVHIYSSEQILALLDATHVLGSSQSLSSFTAKALLGLLAATGLRISEALRLEWRALDWKRGLLLVRQSKSGRSRQIPLHPSCLVALRKYRQLYRKKLPAGADPHLFLTPQGRRLKYDQVQTVFARLRRDLGWSEAVPRPRLHDLRHTFAVNCLARWYEQKKEIGSKILGLTTYLGHRRVSDTYWYLSAVPRLMWLARQRWEKHDVTSTRECP